MFKQGRTAYKASDYNAALRFFRKAQALYSHEALIILALAKTLDRAKELENARKYYKLFLAEAPPTDRARGKTVSRIGEIEELLAKRPAILVLQNLPTSATVRINGQDMSPNARGELELPSGTYKIHVDLQHHYPFARAGITLKAGERRVVPVVLKRVPDPSTLPHDHTWTWVAGTATGVGLLATGAFGLQQFLKNSEYLELATAAVEGGSKGGYATDFARKKFGCLPAEKGGALPQQCPAWEAAVSEIKADHDFYRTATAVSGLATAALGVAAVVAYFAAPVKGGSDGAPSAALQLNFGPTGARSIGLALRF